MLILTQYEGTACRLAQIGKLIYHCADWLDVMAGGGEVWS